MPARRGRPRKIQKLNIARNTEESEVDEAASDHVGHTAVQYNVVPVVEKSPLNRDNVKNLVEKDPIFNDVSINIKTTLNILQEIDHLAQKFWPHSTGAEDRGDPAAESLEQEELLGEQARSNAPVDDPAEGKNKHLIWHLIKGVLCFKNR